MSSSATRVKEFDQSRTASSFWHAPIRFLFGYDVFISYARADADGYAEALEIKLEALGFATFRDKREINAGDRLDETLRKAIRRSRQFVLLDTPSARESNWVVNEVDTYLQSKRPRLTRIVCKSVNPDDSHSDWANTHIKQRMQSFVWTEDTPEAFATGRPGDEVIEQVRNNFRTLRLRNLMRIALAAIIAILSGLLLWSVIQTMAAKKEVRIATSRELLSRSLLCEATDPELSVLLAMYAVSTTLSADHLVLPEAEGQLHRAVLSSHVRLTMRDSRGLQAVAWSPDGKLLATGTEDGKLKLWDAASGKEMLAQGGHAFSITSVAWSPDGTRLATGSDDQTVKIWGASGHELRTLTGSKAKVNNVAWNPDGKRLAAGSWYGTVKIWNTDSGEDSQSFVAGDGYISSLAWNPDGDRIALGTGGGQVFVWSVSKKIQLRELDLGSTSWGMAWRSDGKRLASASRNGTIKVWDPDTGAELSSMDGFFFTSVAWSPQGNRIATGSRDQTAKIWDAETGTGILTLSGHTGYVTSVAWSPDGQRLATASLDHTARVWDTDTGYELPPLKGLTDRVTSVAWSKDGKELLTRGNWNEMLDRGRSADRKMLATFNSKAHQVTVVDSDTHRSFVLRVEGDAGLEWSPNDKWLAIGSEHQVTIVDSATERSFTLDVDNARVLFYWSPDSKRLAFGSKNEVTIVDSAAERSSVFKVEDGVAFLRWSPDSKALAISHATNQVSVLDLATRQPHLFKVNDAVVALEWSPDNETLAAGTERGATFLLDAKSDNHFRSLTRHSRLVRELAWDPGGKRLASASADGTSKVWDAESGVELVTLSNHTDQVFNLAWSPDGKRLATSSADMTIQVYLMDVKDLMALARQRITRDLTNEEIRTYLHTANGPSPLR